MIFPFLVLPWKQSKTVWERASLSSVASNPVNPCNTLTLCWDWKDLGNGFRVDGRPWKGTMETQTVGIRLLQGHLSRTDNEQKERKLRWWMNAQGTKTDSITVSYSSFPPWKSRDGARLLTRMGIWTGVLVNFTFSSQGAMWKQRKDKNQTTNYSLQSRQNKGQLLASD